MNTLALARQEISTLLGGAGITVREFIPERVSPPLAVIEPGDPYMQQGDTFTTFEVRMNVILLAGPWTNQKSTADLDQLIVDAVDALDTWFIESVSQPQAFEANNVAYMGVRIALTDQKELQT